MTQSAHGIKNKMLLLVLLVVLNCHNALAANPHFTTPTPQTGKINEYQSSGKKLVEVQCTDGDSDTTKVSVQSVSPSAGTCSRCFDVFPESGYSTYSLQFLPQGTLDYRTTSYYIITLNCSDSNGNKADNSFVLELRVIPNTPPSMEATSPVVLYDTKNKKAGEELYNVGCTDVNDDPLTFDTFKASPYGDYFRIDSSGSIRATKDLNTLCHDVINFEVTCKDPTNPPVGPARIEMRLNGTNQKPVVRGLNRVEIVPEDTVAGTALVNFTVTDDDPPQCSLQATPTESLQYFGIGPDKTSIVLKKAFDYETTPLAKSTNVSVTCTDYLCAALPAFVVLQLEDTNDPIVLTPSTVYVEVDEGRISQVPLWSATDQDVGDTVTYRITNDTSGGLFVIDSTTGVVTSTRDYDVDAPQYRSTLVILEIEGKDQGGSSSTTTMTLSVNDVNDNKPQFNQSQYIFGDVTACDTIGENIGSVFATDADISFQSNNDLAYSGGGGELIIIPNGSVLVNSALRQNIYTIQATARDFGKNPGPLQSDPVTVTIIVGACPPGSTPPPTTATTPPTTGTAAAGTATTGVAPTGTGSGLTANGTGLTTPTSASGGLLPGSDSAWLNLTSPNQAAPMLEHNFAWIIAASVVGGAVLLTLVAMVAKVCFSKQAKVFDDAPPPRRDNGPFRQERYDRNQLRRPEDYYRDKLSPSAISYHEVARPPPKITVYDPWKGRGLPY